MLVTSFLTFALAALTAAQNTDTTTATVVSVDNPNTQYLTETDSNGVITGMPTVATSQPGQPAVVTSQPDVASIYAGLSSGLNTVLVGNQTLTVSVSGTLTSVVKATPTPTSSPGSGGASGGSATGSSSSKGAAATGQVAAGALIGAAGVFAMLF
jgi:hypothetical protein